MSVRRFCDRCTEEVTTEIAKYTLYRKAELNRFDLGNQPFLRETDLELCPACDDDLSEFLGGSK